MNDLKHTMTDRVFDTIDECGVTPKSQWQFMLHEWVIWGVAGLAFVIGSIATALTLYIGDASFFTAHHIALSPERNVFDMLPFIWIVLLVVGLFYSIHAFRGTRGGYRFQTGWLVGIAIGLSVGVGWSMYAAGFSELIDRYLLAEMPMYQPLSGFKPAHWMSTEAGVVAGFVEEVQEDVFVVRALDGGRVEVITTASTTLPDAFEVCEGAPVRVIGTTTVEGDEAVLQADDVRPFRGRGAMMRNEHGQKKEKQKNRNIPE